MVKRKQIKSQTNPFLKEKLHNLLSYQLNNKLWCLLTDRINGDLGDKLQDQIKNQFFGSSKESIRDYNG